MVWWKRWKAQLSHHKALEFANLLIKLGVVSMIVGVVGVPVIGWVGVALFVTGLVVLCWADSLLPNYDKGKEE